MDEREYGKKPLTEKELREIIAEGPIGDFLNTRTPLYRKRKMKEGSPSKEEAIKFMLRDPNLLKRPITIKGRKKVLGFDEAGLNGIL